MNPRLLTRPVTRVLAVAGFLLALAGVIYLLSGMPAPREQDRVGPANGAFSIIKPRGWEDRVSYSPIDRDYMTTLEIRPQKSVGREPKLWIGRFAAKPDLEKLKSAHSVTGTFQGQDALIISTPKRGEYVWRAIFQRGKDWYDINLRLPGPVDIPNSDWWAFLTSFQCHPIPAHEPVTAPATSRPVLPFAPPRT